jgi:hypothetical protein
MNRNLVLLILAIVIVGGLIYVYAPMSATDPAPAPEAAAPVSEPAPAPAETPAETPAAPTTTP